MFVILLAIASLIVAGVVATHKNRNVIGWILITLLFFPIVLVLLFLPKKPGDQNSLDSSLKKCPHCAEDIKIEATLCRFCNKEFPPQPEFSA